MKNHTLKEIFIANSQFCRTFLIVSLLFCSSACSLLSPPSTGRPVEYIRGELTSNFDSPLNSTWAATQSAMEGLGLTIKSRRADGLSAVLKTEDAQTRTIEITVEKIDDNNSVVKIHVGLLGDADFSKKLMDAIDAKLKK